MYVGLYVAANRDKDQFAEQNPHDRDGDTGLIRWLWTWLKRAFAHD